MPPVDGGAEADRIEQAAKKRLAKDGHHPETLNVGLVIMLFEALPFSSPLPADKAEGTRRRAQRHASDAQASEDILIAVFESRASRAALAGLQAARIRLRRLVAPAGDRRRGGEVRC